MPEFDLYFELIKYFGQEKAGTIYKRLRYFKFFSEVLSHKSVFLWVYERLGQTHESWTLSTISNKIADFESPNENVAGLDQTGEVNLSLPETQIKTISAAVDFLKNYDSFNFVLDSIQVDGDLNLPEYYAFTICAILEGLTAEHFKERFIQIRDSNIPTESIGKVLTFFAETDWEKSEALIDEFLEMDRSKILTTLDELKAIGLGKIVKTIVRKYLQILIDSKIIKNPESPNQSQAIQIVDRNNLIIQILNLGEQTEEVKSIIEDLKKETVFFLESIRNSFQENDQSKAEDYSSSANTIQDMVSRFLNLAAVERTEAEILGKQIIQCIKNNKHSFEHPDNIFEKEVDLYQFLSDFEKLGMIEEAFWIGNYFWNKSRDLKLGQYLGELAFTFGDFHNASSIFKELSLSNPISRTEKIQFATSLEALEQWETAYQIRKDLNFVDQKDIYGLVFCATLTNNFELIQSEISESHPDFQLNPFYKLCQSYSSGELSILDIYSFDLNDDLDQELKTRYIKQLFTSKPLRKVDRSVSSHNKRLEKGDEYIWGTIFEAYLNREILSEGKIDELLLRVDSNSREIPSAVAICLVELAQSNNKLHKLENRIAEWRNVWPLAPEFKIAQATIKNNFKKFDEALHLLDGISHPAYINQIVAIKCLSLMKCRVSDFPLGIEQITPSEKKQIEFLINGISENQSRTFEVELIEIFIKQQPRSAFLEKKLVSLDLRESTKKYNLLGAIGIAYFEENRFDLAISKLKKASDHLSNNQIIFSYLIRSYAKLQLWDVAFEILENNINKGTIKIHQLMAFQKYFIEGRKWEGYLQENSPYRIEHRILLSMFYSSKGKFEEAKKLLLGVKDSLFQDKSLWFAYCSALIQCNDPLRAERTIQLYLSNVNNLSREDYLIIAGFYELLHNYPKAIHLLQSMSKEEKLVILYKAYLFEKSGKPDRAANEIRRFLNDSATKAISILNEDKNHIFYPDFVKVIHEGYPSSMNFIADLLFKVGDLNSLMDFINTIDFGSAESRKQLEINLEIGYYLDQDEILNEVLDIKSIQLEKLTNKSILIAAEHALLNNHEVAAADLFSYAVDTQNDNFRYEILRSRLLRRNGNASEANRLYEAITPLVLSNDDCRDLWLAEAAIEYEDFDTAIKIIKKQFEIFGPVPRITTLFLDVLAKLLTKQLISNLINKENQTRIPNEIKIEDLIIDFTKEHNHQYPIKEKVVIQLNYCRKFLLERKIPIDEVQIFDKDRLLALKIRYIFESKGANAARIVLNNFPDNVTAKITYLLLLAEIDVKAAKIFLNEINQQSITHKPEIYSVIARIHEIERDYPSAFAAMVSAAELKPSEFDWQVLAGTFALKMGKNKTAYKYFLQGKKIRHGYDFEELFLGVYKKSNDYRAIPILISKLGEGKEDGKTLKSIIQILIKNKDFVGAGRYLDNLRFVANNKDYYTILKAKVAAGLNNQRLAHELLSNLNIDTTDDPEIVKLYFETIIEIDPPKDYPHDIDLFENELPLDEYTVAIGKSRMIEKQIGVDEALIFLLGKINDNSPDELHLRISELFIENGDYGKAKSFLAKIHRQDWELIKELLSNIALREGNLDKAKDLLIELIEANPFKFEYYIQLSEIYRKRQEDSKIIEVLEEGLLMNPSDKELNNQKSQYLQLLGGNNRKLLNSNQDDLEIYHFAFAQ